MKVVYAIPAFLDYRLPFYKELNRLFKGDFHVIYSKERYKILRREDLFNRIANEMGNNAHPLDTDYLFDTHSMSFHMKDIEKGFHIPFTFGLIRKIRKLKPDVLITEGFFQWTPLVILYSILFNVPVYIGYERTSHTERNTRKLITIQRKWTDKFVKGYLVNGVETKKYLESIGIDKRKIHLGGMCADSTGLVESLNKLSEKDKSDFRKKILGNRINGQTYLFVGKICERKGVGQLLDAWDSYVKNNPEDTLIIVGSGSLLDKFKKAKEDDKTVIFCGSINYSDVYKYYAIADIFVLPTMEDNWSLVVPEAMACGKPIATTIYNGCHPELVHYGKNGYVFDPNDVNDFVKALEYFHHVDLKSFGEASIAIEKEFSTDKCAYRVFNCINHEN